MDQHHSTSQTEIAGTSRQDARASSDALRLKHEPIAKLTREILAIGRRMRLLLALGAWSTLLAVFLLLVSVSAGLDAAIRFPWILRLAILGLILLALLAQFRRRVYPALCVSATPVEVAIRIERMRPELAGRVVPAVEFDLSGATRSSVLAERAVRDADERAAGADLRKIVRYQPTAIRVLALLAVLSGWTAFTIAQPESASVALRRILTPWSGVSWPARTAVESLIQDGVVAARGRPFALRAKLVLGNPETERVRASYRVISSGSATDANDASVRGKSTGAWEEVLLSRQPNGDFERLVDVDGEALEFRFESSDATTDVMRVRFVEPPAIEAAVLSAQPPAYASSMMSVRREELGEGIDARAVVRDPLLEGSDVRLEMKLNRAVPYERGKSSIRVIGRESAVDSTSDSEGASSEQSGVGQPADSSADSSADVTAPSKSVGGGYELNIDASDSTRWVLSGRANESVRIEVTLVDADGISQEEPIAFAFDVIADRAPTATLIEPEQDESVLPDARVVLRAESRDDLALRDAGIEIAMRLGKDGLDSLVLEELAPAFRETTSDDGSSTNGPRTTATEAETERTLELSRLSLKAGDVVVLRAFAEDFLDRPTRVASNESAESVSEVDAAASTSAVASAEREGRRVRSAARFLRIVSDDEFERQVRSSLAGVRRDAMRLDERQAKARDLVERNPQDESARDAQGAVTEGLSRSADALEQLKARLARNGETDGVLAEIVQQADELVDAAQAESSQASSSLDQAAQAISSEEKQRAAAAATGAQESVRKELEDLVGLLDRNEDAWVARKRLDELANKVKQLTRETDQAASRSNGESREELTADARTELDELAERQRNASEEAEQVAQDLRDRAKAIEQADREQSKALEEAAKAIEDGRVRDEMEQAASDAQQNRLEQSKGAQQRASDALTKAAEALANDKKVRAEELARELESLVDSIRRLLDQAAAFGSELAEVDSAATPAASAVRDGLARSVGVLSQNARGTASDARSMSRESARAARFVDDAADRLASVANKLRIDPYPKVDAETAMAEAQKALEDALAAAEEAQDRAEERAEEEKRDELLVKYRDFLEREAAIRGSTERIVPTDGGRLARRELIESRRLGTVQEELRVAVDALRNAEPDIQDSDALVEMHDIIDRALREAKTGLTDGKPAAALPLVDEALEAFSTIVSALDEAGQADDDRFEESDGADGGGEGGSGGGPQGAVPPVAEIKILKGLQESLARQTRRFSEQADTMDSVTRAQQLAELAAKQQRIVELGSKIAEKIGTGNGSGTEVRPKSEREEDGSGGGGSSLVPQHASTKASLRATEHLRNGGLR